MMNELINVLKKFFTLIGQLIVLAFLVFFSWLFWYFYQEAHLDRLFQTEGHPVQVTVTDSKQQHRMWLDAFGNSHYVSFAYNKRSYTTRMVFDSTWISSGDRIQLLYHPQFDEFRQVLSPRKPGRITSQLIHWSVVGGFSREYQALTGFLLILACLVIFAGGMLATLTGLKLLQQLGQILLAGILLVAALFFTYDALTYFQYYTHLKQSGQPLTVVVEDTQRDAIGRNTSSDKFPTYTYQAVIKFRNEDHLIPIEEDEYDELKPPAQLAVLYDSEQDDLMSATYTPAYLQQTAVPLFLWAMILWRVWEFLKRKSKPQPVV